MYVRSMQFWSEHLVWRGFRCRQNWQDNIKIGNKVKVKLPLTMPWMNAGEAEVQFHS